MPEKLTKSYVEKLPAAPDSKAVYYFDSEVKGFAVRVSGQTKTYLVQGRPTGSAKLVRIAIGRHGTIYTEEARKIAKQHLGQMAQGINPKATSLAAEKQATTLSQALADYIEGRKADQGGGLRQKTISVYSSALNRCFPDWMDMPVAEITPNMVAKRYQELATTEGPRSKAGGAKAQASQAFRTLRSVLNFTHAMSEGADGKALLPDNPVKKLSNLHRGWNKVSRKEGDIIKKEQLKDWYQAVVALNNPTMSHFLLFCLFSGLRRNAASTLTWDNVNFQTMTIYIPDEIDKMGKAQALPISDVVKTILESRVRVLNNPYVFPGEKEGECLQEPKRAIAKVIKKSGVKFSCHTLRKTFATAGESLDISQYKLKYLLNHSVSNDVTAHHYITIDTDQLREPNQKIADFLKEHCGIIRPPKLDIKAPKQGQA
ncbi:MAG: tyrosine-type recombinase/integrase [Candidatus Obscuribacter sp.]|nr:tyrosine-type recombinase/integrase [Candidatus Obscuribacter sp.]MBP6591634.1 tyrosine-type recombinase/integrase [Candidatus Obscuribacter sp.]MBP7575818.1 tyrosine-type recombinase/integrase [Candidatus Obscuribacter sp.]